MAAARMLADHSSTVQAFLRALRKGAHDYHDAFTAPDGKRRDGPGAADALAMIGKYTHLPSDQVRLGIAYVDAAARLDRRDILHQLLWFKQQNLLGATAAGAVIAQDYVISSRYRSRTTRISRRNCAAIPAALEMRRQFRRNKKQADEQADHGDALEAFERKIQQIEFVFTAEAAVVLWLVRDHRNLLPHWPISDPTTRAGAPGPGLFCCGAPDSGDIPRTKEVRLY